MKRIILGIMAAAAAVGAFAQPDVVKNAERALKEDSEASKVVSIITPAFSDPTTARLAQTWYIPGKACYGEYDRLLGLKQFNRLPEGGDAKMGHLLIDGYNYYTKAFVYDSLPNEKGKIKPKYSKDMIGTIAGHFNDLVDAGANLYNAGDYNGAYQAWDIFLNMGSDPTYTGKIAQFADSVYGEIAFNQGIAAWQLDSLENALDAFYKAKSFGYQKKNLYDYSMSIAGTLGRTDTVLALAQEAQPLYGSETDIYLRQIINYYLQARDFDKAFSIINSAIETNPDNAAYYVIRGVLYENNDNKPSAIADYKKAIELDSENADALFNYGRQLCEAAYSAADEAPTIEAEYIPYAEKNITPKFKEAADVLEHAYSISSANPDSGITGDILNYLENVYYNLHDEAKLADTQNRKKLY